MNDTGYNIDGSQPILYKIIRYFRKKDLHERKSEPAIFKAIATKLSSIPGDHMVKREDFQKVMP